MVADIKMNLTVGRGSTVTRSFRIIINKKSICMFRSWISSRMMCVQSPKCLAWINFDSRTPVVQNKSLVSLFIYIFSSNPTLYPINWPSFNFRSSQIRVAFDDVAILVGCATMILHRLPLEYASSKMYCGNCVVFPQPVGPCKIVKQLFSIVSNISARCLNMGKWGGVQLKLYFL